jgi:hypothetical protein
MQCILHECLRGCSCSMPTQCASFVGIWDGERKRLELYLATIDPRGPQVTNQLIAITLVVYSIVVKNWPKAKLKFKVTTLGFGFTFLPNLILRKRLNCDVF